MLVDENAFNPCCLVSARSFDPQNHIPKPTVRPTTPTISTANPVPVKKKSPNQRRRSSSSSYTLCNGSNVGSSAVAAVSTCRLDYGTSCSRQRKSDMVTIRGSSTKTQTPNLHPSKRRTEHNHKISSILDPSQRHVDTHSATMHASDADLRSESSLGEGLTPVFQVSTPVSQFPTPVSQVSKTPQGHISATDIGYNTPLRDQQVSRQSIETVGRLGSFAQVPSFKINIDKILNPHSDAFDITRQSPIFHQKPKNKQGFQEAVVSTNCMSMPPRSHWPHDNNIHHADIRQQKNVMRQHFVVPCSFKTQHTFGPLPT